MDSSKSKAQLIAELQEARSRLARLEAARPEQDRRRTEEMLRNTRNRLQEAQRVAQVGDWEWDPEEDLVTWSEQIFHILGLDLESPVPSYEGQLALYRPKDAERLHQAVRECQDRGTPYELELRRTRPDGQEVVVLARGLARFTEDGKLHRLYGTLQDITERKWAEEWFRLLFEQSPISLWVEDFSEAKRSLDELRAKGVKDLTSYLHAHPDTARQLAQQIKIVNVNQATLSLYRAESKGSFYNGLAGIFDEESLESFINELEPICNGVKSFILEKTHRTLTGERLNVQLHWSRVPGYEESQEKVLVGVVDMTDRKRAEEELLTAKRQAEAASKAKSEFLANMSHEIRTPLNGILGMLQLLQTTAMDAEQSEYVNLAITSSKRLTRLLSDILDLTKIEADKMDIREERFELANVMQSIADIFAQAAKEQENELFLDLDPAVPDRLLGDSTRLTQILFNLVGNAIKYTRQGRIDIRADRLPGIRPHTCQVLFNVEDTGKGIAEDMLHRIFESFTQGTRAGSPYSRQYEGAGLGLPLVKRLVELMGGNASVSSREGGGTGESFAGKQAGEARQWKVLLADDDAMTRIQISRLLQRRGCEVHVTENGEQALEELTQNEYDTVLMDVQMPSIDGVEATRRIRTSQAAFRNIPIIALTAFAMTGDRESFLQAGMNDYISKPVDPEELMAAIRRNLAGPPQPAA
jgi:PAS domain S-box-containing protein